MRKFLNFITLAFLVVSLACSVFAADAEITYFKANTVQVQSTVSNHVPIGDKVYRYYSADGELLWQVTLHGSFRRSPTGVRCVESVCDIEIFDDRWYILSENTSFVGANAMGEVVMGRSFLGIPVDRETVRMNLNSDWYGTIR